MNFIKKYRLKKKLKKAIDYLEEDNKEKVGTPYMCIAFIRYDIDKKDIPEFNFKSFKEFIKIHYPELTCYLNKSLYREDLSIFQHGCSWMMDYDGNYPGEQIIKAKKHYLTHIMCTL